MTAEFHQRIRDIFDRASELPDAERMTFVSNACGGDENLLDQVKRLLQARRESEAFMKTGAGPGQRIGRYLVHGELGRGGMGVVYDAIDSVIQRNVALKVINLRAINDQSEAEFMRERLFREARSCGQLFHPNIVIIFDVGEQDQSAFIAMERVDGPSLQRVLSGNRRLTTDEIFKILRETASALDHAHQHGIVHRDIKPGNIMIRNDGTVKVADFGIAKILASGNTTMTGVIMGTPSYMSPEQIEGRATVDGRSDQFSLAVLAYELFAGVRPFDADSLPTMAHMIVYGERPSPRVLNTSLPLAIDAVFQRALARAAEHRFTNCTAFVDAIEDAFKEAPVPEQPPPLPEPKAEAPAMSMVRTNDSWLKFTLVAALLFICFGLVSGAYLFRAELRARIQSMVQPTAVVEPSNSKGPSSTVTPLAPAKPAKTDDAPKAAKATVAPIIRQFKVDPPEIKTGDPATLKWDVSGADTVLIDHGVGKVALSDTSIIGPTTSTTYVLTASNSAGTSHRTASIDVQLEAIPPAVRARQLLNEALERKKSGNLEEAFALFSQSANLGSTSAMLNLGECYRDAEGATQDEVKALSWFRRAADAGNTSAMVAVGALYLVGVNGADSDDQEANKWFQMAADRGDASGLYNLAMSYEKGRGVTKSLDKAKELYDKSAKTGNSEAQKRLNQLQSHK